MKNTIKVDPFEKEVVIPLFKEEAEKLVDWLDLLETITSIVRWTVYNALNDEEGTQFFFGYNVDAPRVVYFVDIPYNQTSGLSKLTSLEQIEEIRAGIKQDIMEFASLDIFEEWFNAFAKEHWSASEDINEFVAIVNDQYILNLKELK